METSQNVAYEYIIPLAFLQNMTPFTFNIIINNPIQMFKESSYSCRFVPQDDLSLIAANTYHDENDGREDVNAEAETDVDRTERETPIFAVFIFGKVLFINLL